MESAKRTIGLWEQAEKEQWPSITNARGATIFIAPRRYTIQLERLANAPHISKEQIQAIKNIAAKVHDYRYAPEPLCRLDSIFQVLGAGNGHTIYFEQYKQLEDTKKSLNEYIGNFKRKLDTGKDMDRNSNGNKRSSDVQDENDGGSNNSYSFGTKRIKRLKNKSSGLFQNEEKISNSGTHSSVQFLENGLGRRMAWRKNHNRSIRSTTTKTTTRRKHKLLYIRFRN